MLATRFAKLARTQQKVGGWWSVENPAKSFLWDIPPFRALKQKQGVRFIVGDQCLQGGPYRKPTGWLGNAPFLG
eukprot:14889354-Heterocapsa_arctica.AAC.1